MTPTFRYRALSATGEMRTGSITAADAEAVSARLGELGLLPIETERVAAQAATGVSTSYFSTPSPEDLTLFTGDLALLLKTGARIEEALALLASDKDIGRMRATLAAVSSAILAGEGFSEAISRHPNVFPPLYLALTRVGEASGALVPVLETLAAERERHAALRRRFTDALRYPAFLALAAASVFVFFLVFVLPQFGAALRDFNAKLDPTLLTFLALSAFLNSHGAEIGVGLLAALVAVWLVWSRPAARGWALGTLARAPLARRLMDAYRAALFCRNLGMLLSSGVLIGGSLRILVDIMSGFGDEALWLGVVDKVRHGGKLSDALEASRALPTMATRTLRLGEETGQLPELAARVADFYEVRLQRGLDRIVGFAGPLAIVVISMVIGGLIVSVMTALLSVNQAIG